MRYLYRSYLFVVSRRRYQRTSLNPSRHTSCKRLARNYLIVALPLAIYRVPPAKRHASAIPAASLQADHTAIRHFPDSPGKVCGYLYSFRPQHAVRAIFDARFDANIRDYWSTMCSVPRSLLCFVAERMSHVILWVFIIGKGNRYSCSKVLATLRPNVFLAFYRNAS